jgi:chromosome segregation ATPase
MTADMEILDAGLVAAEKLYMSLKAHKQIVGEIVSLDDETKRAKLDAEAAKRSLADLQAQVMAAQSELDKLQSEREAAKQQVSELAAEHSQLTNAINAIKNKFRAA